MYITVPNGYDKGKTSATYRNPASVIEAIEYCSNHSHITALSNQGTARTVKINGKVRTWKRDANRIEIPLKYGMYEYTIFTADDLHRILIPVESVAA
jgi:hypothetical protein